MKQILALLTVVGVLGGVAETTVRADGLPPRGQKRIPVDYRISTEKNFPEYEFFTIIGFQRVTPVKLDTTNPVVIPGAGRMGRSSVCSFVAVPKDAAKKYASEAEFLQALRNGTVEGLVRAKTRLGSTTTVKESDPRKMAVVEYRVEKITATEGIVLVPAKTQGTSSEAQEDSTTTEDAAPPTTFTRAGLLLGGLSLSAAVLFMGLWMVRRTREL